MLFIDTLLHPPTQATKLLEREVLREYEPPNRDRLVAYLEAYCAVVGTDEIMLKVDAAAADIDAPESYTQHKELIAEHLSSEQGREFEGENSDNVGGCDDVEALEEVELEPLGVEAG